MVRIKDGNGRQATEVVPNQKHRRKRIQMGISRKHLPVPVHVGKGCKPTKRDYINLYKLHMNRLISCKKELFGFFK